MKKVYGPLFPEECITYRKPQIYIKSGQTQIFETITKDRRWNREHSN